MKENRVFDSSVTGRPGDILSTMLRKNSALTRENRVRWFKIGITNSPMKRFNGHKRHYDVMILIYRSLSINYVRDLEWELIEHNREFADNFIGGGGGRGGGPPYFMYVVVKYW